MNYRIDNRNSILFQVILEEHLKNCSEKDYSQLRDNKLGTIDLATSFPSPSVAVQIARKRSLETVNLGRRKWMLNAFLCGFSKAFGKYLKIIDQVSKIKQFHSTLEMKNLFPPFLSYIPKADLASPQSLALRYI